MQINEEPSLGRFIQSFRIPPEIQEVEESMNSVANLFGHIGGIARAVLTTEEISEDQYWTFEMFDFNGVEMMCLFLIKTVNETGTAFGSPILIMPTNVAQWGEIVSKMNEKHVRPLKDKSVMTQGELDQIIEKVKKAEPGSKDDIDNIVLKLREEQEEKAN